LQEDSFKFMGSNTMHSHQQCEQILREVLLTLSSSPLETMKRTEQMSTALGLSPWQRSRKPSAIQASSIRLLTKVLKKMGFEPMPSDPCVVMHNQAHRTRRLRQRLMLPRRGWVSLRNSSGISPSDSRSRTRGRYLGKSWGSESLGTETPSKWKIYLDQLTSER
jgi:hypothetical protein